MTFYEKLNNLCINQGTSVTALAVSLGYSRSIATTWKNSKGMPRANTVKKIAEHFNLPISYFYENEQHVVDETNVNSANAVSDSGKKITASFGDIERELLAVCSTLDMKRKNALLTKAYELEQEFLSETFGLDKKRETHDTVTVYAAAKSSDNHPPRMTEISRDKWETLENAPETDEDLF